MSPLLVLHGLSKEEFQLAKLDFYNLVVKHLMGITKIDTKK